MKKHSDNYIPADPMVTPASIYGNSDNSLNKIIRDFSWLVVICRCWCFSITLLCLSRSVHKRLLEKAHWWVHLSASSASLVLLVGFALARLLEKPLACSIYNKSYGERLGWSFFRTLVYTSEFWRKRSCAYAQASAEPPTTAQATTPTSMYMAASLCVSRGTATS
jgi:hypothetical protein